jgi:hypothetical protein
MSSYIKVLSLVVLTLLLVSCATVEPYKGEVSFVALQSREQVQGFWKLQSVKNSITDNQAIYREDTWFFNDGQVSILHIPREGTYYDQAPVPYDVEEGKLKIGIIGSNQSELFTVVEMTKSTMTLIGKFGGYYFFTKEQGGVSVKKQAVIPPASNSTVDIKEMPKKTTSVNLDEFKAQCKALGFKAGTQDFGNCVLQLNEGK